MKTKWLITIIIVILIVLGINYLLSERADGNSAMPNALNNNEFAEEDNVTSKILDATEVAPQTTILQLEDYGWENREIYKSGLTTEAQVILDNLPTATVYHLSINIPDEISKGITGHLALKYFNNENETLEDIYFRTFPNYNGGSIDIMGLSVNGALVEYDFVSNDSAIRVKLEKNLEPGEYLIIVMDFVISIPTEMGGNYGLFGYFDDILVLDTFYPVIPVYDHNGWYKQIPQSNGDLSYQDISFYLVEVEASTEMVLISSGVEIESTALNGRKRTLFAAGPARDFYLAGSEKFTKISGQIGETTVNSFTFSENAEHQQYSVNNAIQALDLMGQRYGAYPYTEFDILSSPMLALGVEYPGVTSIIMDEFISGKTMYSISTQAMLESTVVHEVGHQWFYNAVGNDQQNQPWVDESLTQFATYLFFLDAYGNGDGFLASLESRWSRLEYAKIPVGMQAGDYSGSEYSAIVYGRGPLFFHELAKDYGLDMVTNAIRKYYQDNLWGISGTEDIRYFLESECKCDLQNYFEEWIYFD